ncbi:MAG: hypothetical protein KC609_10535 [Myxococcales bacterium]|nr:hypothetical protein [Myxococcales bacterium]
MDKAPMRCPACGKTMENRAEQAYGTCPHCKQPLQVNYWATEHVKLKRSPDGLGAATLLFAGIGIAVVLYLLAVLMR